MYLRSFVTILIAYASIVLGIRIGITPDYYDYSVGELKSISFSAQINFADRSIPGDRNKMSDGQLINLAKVAYLEMVTLWERYLVDINYCPGTMMAMVSEGSVYFTSSIKQSSEDTALAECAALEGSPLSYIKSLSNGALTHRRNGCCAEPNGLCFYAEQNARSGEPFRRPPIDDAQPRIAVWLRPNTRKSPRANTEKSVTPCSTIAGKGYGCDALATEFGLKTVDTTKIPDPTGEDDWVFTTVANRRELSRCGRLPEGLQRSK